MIVGSGTRHVVGADALAPRPFGRIAPDVFFAPAYTAPLALRVPLVVTIHDVSFAAHPEWFAPREGARRRLLTRQAARARAIVLTDSEFSRREIRNGSRAPVDRIVVIPPGVTRRVSRLVQPLVPRAARAVRRIDLQSPPAAGDLITAFAQATARRPDARLVHRRRPTARTRTQHLDQLAEAAGMAARVDVRRYVNEVELRVFVRARLGVRVPLRLRRLRPDAARSPRPPASPSSSSTRRSRARCTAMRRRYVRSA